MEQGIPESAIHEKVCKSFPVVCSARQIELQPASFSGARVWKIMTAHKAYALKQWPVGQPVHLPLPEVHRYLLQARASGLVWIPEVYSTTSGTTVLQVDQQNWDLCSWQAGKCSLTPDVIQMEKMARALTQLHAVWRMGFERIKAPCRAVQFQYVKLANWSSIPMQVKHATCNEDLYQEAFHAIEQYRHTALQRLKPWLTRPVAMQPCIADLRVEHILFDDQEMTGIVDYGGMRIDHPAQDFARLFTSMSEISPETRSRVLAAYHPVTHEFESLLGVLESCGLLVGIVNWYTWLTSLTDSSIPLKQGEERLKFQLKRLYSTYK